MTKEEYRQLLEKISNDIHSDSSPVGIDAKKTHILILAKLEVMHEEIKELRAKIKSSQ